jgi:hypothetical protein
MKIEPLICIVFAVAGGSMCAAWATESDELAPSAIEAAKPHGYFQPGPRLGEPRRDNAPLEEPARCPPSAHGDSATPNGDHGASRGLPPGLQPAPGQAPGACLEAKRTTDSRAAAPSPTK